MSLQILVFRPAVECFPYQNAWSWARARFRLSMTIEARYLNQYNVIGYFPTVNGLEVEIWGDLPPWSGAAAPSSSSTLTSGVLEYPASSTGNYGKGAFFRGTTSGVVDPASILWEMRAVYERTGAAAGQTIYQLPPAMAGEVYSPGIIYQPRGTVVFDDQASALDQTYTLPASLFEGSNLRGGAVDLELSAETRDHFSNLGYRIQWYTNNLPSSAGQSVTAYSGWVSTLGYTVVPVAGN